MTQAPTWAVPSSAEAPVTPANMFTRIDQMLDAQLSQHRGATRPSYAVAGTVWVDSDDDKAYYYDGTNDLELMKLDADGNLTVPGELVLAAPTAPASASAAGIAGQIAWDADYIYVCTATDTWKRVAIATW